MFSPQNPPPLPTVTTRYHPLPLPAITVSFPRNWRNLFGVRNSFLSGSGGEPITGLRLHHSEPGRANTIEVDDCDYLPVGGAQQLVLLEQLEQLQQLAALAAADSPPISAGLGMPLAPPHHH